MYAVLGSELRLLITVMKLYSMTYHGAEVVIDFVQNV